ncbi:hypothetical protein [Streptomyces sp. NPDC093223]|uniref:hypothetical protein n=1 Tax=Streptomyces sp. NPDC093223 TaxID=3366033 RepID=UPI00380ED3F0
MQQIMTAKPRRSSRQVQARETAREKASRFRELEEERLRIAEEVILLQEEIADFDAETERRVAALREDRRKKLVEKRGRVDALVVDMLDTEVPAQQAAERLDMSVGQVRAAKRNFDQAVAALAVEAPSEQAPDDAVPSAAEGGQDSSVVDAPPVSPAAAPSQTPSFPVPGQQVVVPAQEGSPESAESATLPPGSPG